jgi:hypothetical protein
LQLKAQKSAIEINAFAQLWPAGKQEQKPSEVIGVRPKNMIHEKNVHARPQHKNEEVISYDQKGGAASRNIILFGFGLQLIQCCLHLLAARCHLAANILALQVM